jgi:hypothetical protein
MGFGLAALTRLAGNKTIDRIGLRGPVQNLVTAGTRNGFRAAGAAGRSFKSAQKLGEPARLAPAEDTGLFDVTPSEDQRMIVETVAEFAAEQLRPAAADADAKLEAPEGLLTRAAELGITVVGIPEELGGVGEGRSVVTGALVAEALAHGDLKGSPSRSSRRRPSAPHSCCGVTSNSRPITCLLSSARTCPPPPSQCRSGRRCSTRSSRPRRLVAPRRATSSTA